MTADSGQQLPVIIVGRNGASSDELSALRRHARVSLIHTAALTPEWIALTHLTAGTILVADSDPLRLFGYAVTAGVHGPLVVAMSVKYRSCARALVGAGAAASVTLPLSHAAADRIVTALRPHCLMATYDAALNLLLDPIGRTARCDHSVVRLSQREFALLYALLKNRGAPVATEHLLLTVWCEKSRELRTRQLLEFYVSQLRRKVARIHLRGRIETVRSFGYALTSH